VSLDQESVLLVEQLFNEIISQYDKGIGIYDTKIKEVVKVISLNKSVDLLSHNTKEIRETAKKGILAKLTNIEELRQINYPQVVNILKIIDLSKGQEEYERQLYTTANNRLKQIISDINKEGIAWINEKFGNLPNSSETRTFLRALYHKMLRNLNDTDEISNTDSEFVTKCIEYGFTTTIKRTKGIQDIQDEKYTYQLVFEDVSYTIHHSNELNLANIIQAAIEQDNMLTKQYKEYKPLFENSESGLSIAATDVIEHSIVDNTLSVDSKAWQLSLMHLSDHKKSIPSTIFILFEKRDYFGYHVIHKIYIKGRNICDEPYILHPNEISPDIREKIFSNMKYVVTKPRYYCSIDNNISLEEGEQLIQQSKDYKLEEGDNVYVILHKLFNKKLYDPVWKNIPWEEYVQQESVQTFKKDVLLKISNELVRRDSMLLDHGEKITEHDEQFRKLQKVTQSLQNIIQHSNINPQDKKEMQQHLCNIEQKMQRLETQEIKNIVISLTDLITKGQNMKTRLKDLEDDVDKLQNQTNVYMLDKIVYDNPLLNNPRLFKVGLKIFNFNQILDLTPKLDPNLVSTAINTDDSFLILAGLLSLTHND
jgi:hypothetical protein